MQIILRYFLIFFIYSILGWLMESTYVSIAQRRFVDRGFLIGPYCPIYGFGAIIIIFYLTQYKDNILTIFILGMVICSFIEYVTSYLMEKIFNARWWDYSDKKMNLNGRICLKNAILFGIGGIAVIYILQPFINKIIYRIDDSIILIITIVFLIIYITDTIVSFNIVNRLKKNLHNFEIRKDSTQELKNLVNEIINTDKMNFLQKRLIKSFPDFELQKFVRIRHGRIKKIKELLKRR